MYKDLQKMKFDSRLLEWNLRNSIITQTEYDTYLSKLSDTSDNAEAVNLEAESSEATMDESNPKEDHQDQQTENSNSDGNGNGDSNSDGNGSRSFFKNIF